MSWFGATVATAVLPPGGSIGALDLALVGDPAARTVQAAYKLDGGPSWTVLPTALTLPAGSAGRNL